MTHIAVDSQYPAKLIAFLVEHNAIALDHQAQAASKGCFHCMPDSWVSWAKSSDQRWKDIMAMYTSRQQQVASNDMPIDLQRFIEKSVSIPFPRTPFYVPESSAPPQVHGVSPKKLHEVFTMSNYVASLLSARPVKPVVVDIGAGQGYLSRALSSSSNNFHVLALDSDSSQTTGSMSRKDWGSTTAETGTAENTSSTTVRGSLRHQTVFIDDERSLNNAIGQWIQDDIPQPLDWPSELPIPVVLVGLHCCGDLTPSILRFLHYSLQNSNNNFEIIGCIIVGCCYNMCGPTSFPLSQGVSVDINRLGPLSLETQHLHLATQSPLTWNLDENAEASLLHSSAALAVRKVTYRALLARRLPSLSRPERDATLCTDVDWRQKRVGRLRGSAYKDFPTYLRMAGGKLGLPANPTNTGVDSQAESITSKPSRLNGANDASVEEYDLESDLSTEELELSRVLEVLYVLRCLIGPAVESLIAIDRYLFLQEVIKSQMAHGANRATRTTPGAEPRESEEMVKSDNVQLVNLFDQSTGSLRNLALVWVK